MSHKKGKGKKKEQNSKKGSSESRSATSDLVDTSLDRVAVKPEPLAGAIFANSSKSDRKTARSELSPGFATLQTSIDELDAKAPPNTDPIELLRSMGLRDPREFVSVESYPAELAEYAPTSSPSRTNSSRKKNKGKKKTNGRDTTDNSNSLEEYLEKEDDPEIKKAMVDLVLRSKLNLPEPVGTIASALKEKTDMTKMLAIMAELEMGKDAEDLSKSFLSECKQKADALVLSEEEKNFTLDEIRGIMDSYPSLSVPECQEHIRDLFVLKININSDMRRCFMEDFGEWKNLLPERKQLIQDRCRVESDIENLTDVTSQLRRVYEDVMKKSTEVTFSTSSLIAAERNRNFEIKSGFDQTLEGILKRYQEHDEDTKRRQSEIQELKDKLEEIKEHFERQKKYFKDRLQERSLLPQIYQSKMQMKKDLEAKYRKELDNRSLVLKDFMKSLDDMKGYMALFEIKRVEVEQQVIHTREMLQLHNKERDEFAASEQKIEDETEALKVEMKEIEASILRNTDTIRRNEALYHNLHKDSRAKVSECRVLQERRNRAQSSTTMDSHLPVAEHPPPIPSSSSSSSSSARPLRELITPTAGEESPAYSPPGSYTG